MKKHLKSSDLQEEVHDRICDCEAVEIFNISKITLDDATILADSLFKDVNVNNVTFTLIDEFDCVALADFLSRIKKHCLMYVIQESSDYHMKVTFVHSTPFSVFSKIANRQLDLVFAIYHIPVRNDTFSGGCRKIKQ